VSDENQGQRRNSSPMQADSTQKMEPVMQVLRGVFRRRSLAACLPLANQANLPSRHSHKTKQSSSSKTTHKNPRLSLLKMVFQFLLKCSTPPLPIHAHTHRQSTYLNLLASRSLSNSTKISFSLTGPYIISGGPETQRRCGQAKRGSSKARV
jgi:hypothetical protein